MTHDELLARIDYNNAYLPSTLAQMVYAVVELHKPTPEPVFVSELECKICDSSYPCTTIQAIEKKLL